MYKIATARDTAGTVLVHGEQVLRKLDIVDQSVRLVAGKRVIISDLGQGNNQWAIVRSLGTGTPPAPPQGIELVASLADLVGNLLGAGNYQLGWARTIRYSLSHFEPAIGANEGTAYATMYRAPDDYRLMIPIDLSQGDAPGTPFGRTLVNRVDQPGIMQIPPAEVIGPGNKVQNPADFMYGPMPVEAERYLGGELVGYWFDEAALRDGLPGGAVVGPDAMMSQTVVSVFVGPSAAVTNQIPLFPAADATPEEVFAEDAEGEARPEEDVQHDVNEIESRLNERLARSDFADLPAIFIGADATFPDLGVDYVDAVDRVSELLRS